MAAWVPRTRRTTRFMFTQTLGIENDPFATFLFLAISGFSLYLVVSGLSYLVLFKWLRPRINPDYRPDWKENRTAIKWAFFSIVGNAVLTAPIHVLIATGHSQIYFDVDEHGWGYLFASIGIMLVITETLVYWAHRILHMGFMYRRLHRFHHMFHRPTPWASVSFHPADSFLQALPHHLCAFLFPLHVSVYLLSVTLVTVWAVIIHDRLTIVRWGAINYTDHHSVHHWYYDYNYGQYTTFWDRICGTYRSPKPGAGWWPPREAPEVAEKRYDPMVSE